MGGAVDHLKIGTAILTLKQLRDAPNEGGSGWRCEQLIGPYRHVENVSRLEEGLRQAGLPE